MEDLEARNGNGLNRGVAVREEGGEMVAISPRGRVLGSYSQVLEKVLSAGTLIISPAAWMKRNSLETNEMEWKAPIKFFLALDQYLTDQGWILPSALDQRIDVLTGTAVKFFDAQIEIEKRQTEIARQDAIQSALIAVGETLAASSLQRIFMPERVKVAADVILDAVAVEVASATMGNNPESAAAKIKEIQKQLAEAAIQDRLMQIEVHSSHDKATINSLGYLTDTASDSMLHLGDNVNKLFGNVAQNLDKLSEGVRSFIEGLITKEKVVVFIGGGAVSALIVMNRAGQTESVAFANPGGWIVALGFLAGGSLSVLGWNVVEKGWAQIVKNRDDSDNS